MCTSLVYVRVRNILFLGNCAFRKNRAHRWERRSYICPLYHYRLFQNNASSWPFTLIIWSRISLNEESVGSCSQNTRCVCLQGETFCVQTTVHGHCAFARQEVDVYLAEVTLCSYRGVSYIVTESEVSGILGKLYDVREQWADLNWFCAEST